MQAATINYRVPLYKEAVADPERFPLKPPLTSVVSKKTYSFSAVRGNSSSHFHYACASKGGVVATVHMCMKPPFPNPGSTLHRMANGTCPTAMRHENGV